MDEFCPTLTFPMTVAFGATKLPDPMLGLTSFKLMQARLGVTGQQTVPEENQRRAHPQLHQRMYKPVSPKTKPCRPG